MLKYSFPGKEFILLVQRPCSMVSAAELDNPMGPLQLLFKSHHRGDGNAKCLFNGSYYIYYETSLNRKRILGKVKWSQFRLYSSGFWWKLLIGSMGICRLLHSAIFDSRSCCRRFGDRNHKQQTSGCPYRQYKIQPLPGGSLSPVPYSAYLGVFGSHPGANQKSGMLQHKQGSTSAGLSPREPTNFLRRETVQLRNDSVVQDSSK